jgi:hypothetical protein
VVLFCMSDIVGESCVAIEIRFMCYMLMCYSHMLEIVFVFFFFGVNHVLICGWIYH